MDIESVKLDMDELDLTSAESKATYEEIKKYAIEGIVTTNTRIKQLVEEKTTPKNRD